MYSGLLQRRNTTHTNIPFLSPDVAAHMLLNTFNVASVLAVLWIIAVHIILDVFDVASDLAAL